MMYLIIGVTEFIYAYLKTSLTYSTVSNSLYKGAFETLLLNSIWIVSTSFGVKQFLDGSWWITTIVYGGSGVLGYVLCVWRNKRKNSLTKAA